MFRVMVATLGLFASSVAFGADGVVVWMEKDAPSAKDTERADIKTGGTEHASYYDLAFPPRAASEEDDARYEALRLTVEDGKKRWNDFEVELEIAQSLGNKLDTIDVIRSDRDLSELVQALLFQGAAAQVAFEPDEFRDGDRAEDFRIGIVGDIINRPWADAIALDPDRPPQPGDLADGASYPILSDDLGKLKKLTSGGLKIGEIAEGDTVVVDGKTVDADAVELRPGQHFVHVVRRGVISGRARFQVEEGRQVQLPLLVDEDEMSTARDKVLSGTTAGFPRDVKQALTEIGEHYGGQVFVAARENGRLVVLPYLGAQLVNQRRVTFVSGGELGLGVVLSDLFENAQDGLVTAPAMTGSLSFELGIYNAAILTGLDLAVTPGNVVPYGDSEGTGNESTSVLPQPWGGLGVYFLRPTGTSATLLLAGTMGWSAPAHLTYGGRFIAGVPLGGEGDTWVRLSLGANLAQRSSWSGNLKDRPLHSIFLRGGLSRRF